MASNVLSGSNHEGASANAFAVAAAIVTPLELTVVDAVAADDDNNDGDSAGAEHRGIIPRATSIGCTIARLVLEERRAGARPGKHTCPIVGSIELGFNR